MYAALVARDLREMYDQGLTQGNVVCYKVGEKSRPPSRIAESCF